jgi:hypothetical protein
MGTKAAEARKGGYSDILVRSNPGRSGEKRCKKFSTFDLPNTIIPKS